jgi:predicted nucleotidyltransferase
LRSDEPGRASAYLPPAVWEIVKTYEDTGKRFLSLDDFRDLLIFAVLSCAGSAVQRELSDILSATEGLENRLTRAIRRGRDVEEIVRFTKTKRYTETRIKRLIIHTIMGLTKEAMAEIDEGDICARVLAFSAKGAKLIRRIKKTGGSVPLITNPNREREMLARCRLMAEFDAKAADLRKLVSDGNLGGFRDENAHPALP